jgi:transposase
MQSDPDSPSMEQRRRRAVDLVESGQPAAEVARRLDVSERSVRRWLRAYRSDGDKGLAARAKPGRPSKLTPDQQEELVRILDSSPSAHGCPSDQWSELEIAKLIEREFGVFYTSEYVKDLLTRIAGRDFARKFCPGWTK